MKASRIVRDYMSRLYFPVDEVPLSRRVAITPVLLAVEYLVYRIDALAERNSAVDLEAERGPAYEKFHRYQHLFERLLRAVGGWNDEVARQFEEGERFIRLENAVSASTRPTHAEVIALAELRPADVRLLHALSAALRGAETNPLVRDLLWPVEVLADIANDLAHYKQDVAAGTTNVYASFIDLYGASAGRQLRKEIRRYTALYAQRLEAMPAERREELDRLCRRRFSTVLGPFPAPVTSQPRRTAREQAPPISWSVFATGTLCVIAWIITYAAVINRGTVDKSFGMPIAALAANLAWEFVYGFLLDPLGDYIHILSIPCFLIDVIIASQCWKYGADDFSSPFLRKHFRALLVGAILFSVPAMYMGFVEFDDPDGEYTGFGINLMMSILFIAMMERRDSVAGQSMYIAASKWAGTLLAWMATALTVTTSPSQPLPRSWREFWGTSLRHRSYPLTPLINVMYWATFVVDAVYSVSLYRRLRAAGISPWHRF
ncbi:hypothetical protein [Austwickia chelonae]|uniref:transmembrane-type terpene cyclase n=1 Tax=Austwickia chelonae TaxID=100225 RepID=UPI001967EDF5|nr:hypothetical protein [Austwickia chelonae]